jgi:hypothetical protein
LRQPDDAGVKPPIIGRNVGDSIQGDRILLSCRKHDAWQIIRRSAQHHAAQTIGRMGAFAVIEGAFKNQQK